MSPVLDYRSPEAPAPRPKRSAEESLELENLLITLFVLTLLGGPILLCLWANYGIHH
jgi:hypothetical protein